MLGWAAYAAGDIPLAMRRFEESLAFRRSLGDRFAVTVEIANLADLASEQGDVADAAARLREALITARDLESTYLVVICCPRSRLSRRREATGSPRRRCLARPML